MSGCEARIFGSSGKVKGNSDIVSLPNEASLTKAARTIDPPHIVVHRIVTSPRAMDGIFTITIRNNADIDREAMYSEIWPWWVKGWVSEMQVRIDGRLQGGCCRSVTRADTSRCPRQYIISAVNSTETHNDLDSPISHPSCSIRISPDDPIHQAHAEIH